MFKELGQLAGLMKQLPRIRAEVERLQQRLGQVTAEGTAGAGMVTVKVNGRMEVVACHISDEVLRPDDRELLEDLIRSATNQALDRVRRQVAEETTKTAAGFGINPGAMGFPGVTVPSPSAGAADEHPAPEDPDDL
ncbi:MAG TPA: YbaB/EbfC family nucleoid-associated protein [Gemmataceae bacterium]|nr:YbaB/EbfC family nucleoid-associated protein [Gemmataceae bacterium]